MPVVHYHTRKGISVFGECIEYNINADQDTMAIKYHNGESDV
jgi:hypothetical protein